MYKRQVEVLITLVVVEVETHPHSVVIALHQEDTVLTVGNSTQEVSVVTVVVGH